MNPKQKLTHAPQLQALYLEAMRENEKAERLDVAVVLLGCLIYFSIFIVPLAVLYLQERLPWQ